MKRRHTTVRVTLDDGLGVTTDVAPGGSPVYVLIEEDEGKHGWEAGAVELERIAAYIRDLRWRAGDFRQVCPDHGLYEGVHCGKCFGALSPTPRVANDEEVA